MELRGYQKKISEQAANLLRNFKIAFLCMEVRTGKTLTSLNAANIYGAKKVLFVTKKKAISSILNDYKRINPDYQLYIINYDMLHKCDDNYELIILDESHSLGQYPKPSKRTKYLKKICTGKPIIYLTGTPTPENYSQLYHQFWVSTYSPWGRYRNFYDWFKDYGILKKKHFYNREINDYSNAIEEKVFADISHLFLSYTQKEAGFISEVEDVIVTIQMPDKVKRAINTLRGSKIIRTKDGKVILADTKVKEMQKVHQLCGGTIKCEDGDCIVFDDTKSRYILNYFHGKKIAIFYKFVGELTQLLSVFGARLTVSPEEFNNSSDKIFAAQFQSAREGVNLATADCIIMFNVDFAAVSYWQARARLQAKERTTPAYVYWLFFEGGIEQDVFDVVKKKRKYTVFHYRKKVF